MKLDYLKQVKGNIDLYEATKKFMLTLISEYNRDEIILDLVLYNHFTHFKT